MSMSSKKVMYHIAICWAPSITTRSKKRGYFILFIVLQFKEMSTLTYIFI